MWTIFRRRDDIKLHQDSCLGWEACKLGFGNLTGELCWGPGYLLHLTADHYRSFELEIDLEASDGDGARVIYKDFGISFEAESHILSASGYTGHAGEDVAASAETLDGERGS